MAVWLGLFSVVLIPVLAGVSVLFAVLAGRWRARRLRFDEDAYPGLAALRRSGLVVRWVGVLAGTVAALVLLPLGPHAPLAFAAPLLGALVVVVALILGQQLAYGRARTAGSAGLETRRVTDYLPGRSLAWVAGATGVLAVVWLFTTIAASPDDAGIAGRALRATWAEEWTVRGADGVLQLETALRSGAVTPFPGSFYLPAVAVALLLLVGVAWLGLVLTARRPRNGGDPELVRVDDALRRITSEGIVAAVGAGVGGAILAASAVAYTRLGQFDAVPVYVAACYLFAALALAALVTTLAFVVVLLVPGNGGRR